jgi:hypothetical protein
MERPSSQNSMLSEGMKAFGTALLVLLAMPIVPFYPDILQKVANYLHRKRDK